MNRFKWVNEHTIRIINRDGIEMLIDMKDNYKEIDYNVVPLFDKTELEEPVRSYYFNRNPLTVS